MIRQLKQKPNRGQNIVQHNGKMRTLCIFSHSNSSLIVCCKLYFYTFCCAAFLTISFSLHPPLEIVMHPTIVGRNKKKKKNKTSKFNGNIRHEKISLTLIEAKSWKVKEFSSLCECLCVCLCVYVYLVR